MHPFLVYDIEANGLYDSYDKENADLIWCACFLRHDKKLFIFVKDELVSECSRPCMPLSQVGSFLSNQISDGVRALICHNQIDYDLRMIKKFLGIDYTIKPDSIGGQSVEIIDTLLDSKWLNPNRKLPWGCPGSLKSSTGGKSKVIGPHGLESWGYRVSKKKPEVEDWAGLHIDVYVNRCIEDIHINYGTFEILNSEIAKYFGGVDKLENWSHNRKKAALPIYIEHAFKEDIVRQKENGVPFNIKKAEALLPKFDKEMDDLREKIESHLPQIPIPASRLKDWKFPAKPFKVDKKLGAIPAKSLENFVSKWDGKIFKKEDDFWIDITVDGEKKKYKAPFPLYIKTTEQMTVESEHLGQYIIDTFGWQPSFWNYQVDANGKKIRDANKKLIPTTPRLKDAATGRICPHLLSLDVPFVKDVIRYRTIKHRRQTVKSVKDGEKGYLNHPRLLIDGRIPADMDTIGTSTSRVAHRGICNVPKADDDVLYGHELRDLFDNGGDPDWYFLTYDASQLESRLEGGEAYKYDGGSYAHLLLSTDIHQVRADKFGIKRSQAKSVSYALLYGAWIAKVAQMLDISFAQAEILLNDWWEEYWASKRVIDSLQNEWKSNGKKFIKGIDGRPIFLDSPHLCMNYRLQNAGTVAIKLHECLMREKTKEERDKGLAQKIISYHDENSYLVHKKIVKWKKTSTEEEAEDLHLKHGYSKPFEFKGNWWAAHCPVGVKGIEAIKEAGERLKIKVPLTGVYQIGRSWAETH